MSTLYGIITTIQPPTRAVLQLARALGRWGGQLLLVGDRKGPRNSVLPHTRLLTFSDQLAMPLRLPSLLPADHYVRKNLGYLVAISHRAPVLFETDDDNAPLPEWRPRSRDVQAISVASGRWCNVYRHFSDLLIWPRGLPLSETRSAPRVPSGRAARLRQVTSPIQQGLADGNPDVDAVWRMLVGQDVRFARKPSLALKRGVWCPFNSQCTWWWPEAYPLLYLPSCCTFRMTDIWRSFVAQRCLWELGACVAFHAPEVFQSRNRHDLLRDFEDEVPGYLTNGKILDTLQPLRLKPGPRYVRENLWLCYEQLVQAGVFPKKELRLLRAWLADLDAVGQGLIL